MTDSTTPIGQPDPSEYTVKPVPDINTLETVGAIPVRTDLGDLRRPNHDTISLKAARGIVSELWRLYRDPRLLEVEKAHRDDPTSMLNIEWLSHQHIDDGVLDPTAVAKQFRRAVLEHHTVPFVNSTLTNADSDTKHSEETSTVSV